MVKKKIAVFVPARLKSKRLKLKALKFIGKQESIKWCLNNLLEIKPNIGVYLLTSYLKQDDQLAKLKLNKKIKVFRGHPTNILKRFVDAAEKNNIQTIIRVTGDCPFISREIINFLLKSHIKKKADFTAAKKYSVGTSGEIIEVKVLNFLLKNLKDFTYTEYLTMFFLDNPKTFNLNLVSLPKKFTRNFRLTLDYKKDLDMFNEIYKKSKEIKKKLNINNIFYILDKYKYISRINKNLKLLYTSKNFRKKIRKFTKLKD